MPRQLVLAAFGLVVFGLIAGGVVALLGAVASSRESGWTGAAVKVPSCPADAEGCRIVVIRENHANSGTSGPVIAQEDWSTATTTLNVVLPAGTYAVSAEGCTGYEVATTVVSIRSGFHTGVDLGANWEMPGFLRRTCPGFAPGR